MRAQQVGDRPVAMAGVALRVEDGLVDRQRPAREPAAAPSERDDPVQRRDAVAAGTSPTAAIAPALTIGLSGMPRAGRRA